MRGSPPARAAVAASTHPDPRRAGRLGTAEAVGLLGRERTRAVLLFTSGRHASSAVEVAEGAREQVPDAPIVVVGGSGVVSPEAEMEGSEAISALALAVPVLGACVPADAELSRLPAEVQRVGEALRSPRPRPTLLFAEPSVLLPSTVGPLQEAAGTPLIFGGGGVGEGALAFAAPGEEPVAACLLGLRLDSVRVSAGITSGVVSVGPVLPIEEMDGGFILRIGGRRPLEVLEDSARHRTGRPMVVVTVEPSGEEPEHGRRLVRGVSGIDPARGAIHAGDDIRVGDRLGFAVVDSGAARADMDVMLRKVTRGLAGGVPLAGIYITCPARGRRLYNASGVDARAMRASLGDVPFAGVHASLQVVPHGNGARLVGHTGVLVVLYAPS